MTKEASHSTSLEAATKNKDGDINMEDQDKSSQNETYGYDLSPAEFYEAILDYKKYRLGK